MGSVFNTADVDIAGDFIPDLSNFQFQDKCAMSTDSSICILVQWDTTGNQPGFVLWCLDENSKKIVKTKRFDGCCDDLKIAGNKVLIKIWSWDDQNKTEQIKEEELAIFLNF